jgi:hypothetical protein
MKHRFATVLSISLAVLALCACGGQQSAPDAPSPSPESADSLPPAASSTPPAAAAVASASSGQPAVPKTGRPSAQLCDAGEKYLAKFPDLPQVKSPTGTTPVSVTTMCVYMAAIGGVAAPAATLGATGLAREDKGGAMFRQLCSDDKELKPGFNRMDAPWAGAGGWSVWTKTNAPEYQAIVCTDSHYFSASISNVPGATAQDAVDTILSAIE